MSGKDVEDKTPNSEISETDLDQNEAIDALEEELDDLGEGLNTVEDQVKYLTEEMANRLSSPMPLKGNLPPNKMLLTSGKGMEIDVSSFPYSLVNAHSQKILAGTPLQISKVSELEIIPGRMEPVIEVLPATSFESYACISSVDMDPGKIGFIPVHSLISTSIDIFAESPTKSGYVYYSDITKKLSETKTADSYLVAFLAAFNEETVFLNYMDASLVKLMEKEPATNPSEVTYTWDLIWVGKSNKIRFADLGIEDDDIPGTYEIVSDYYGAGGYYAKTIEIIDPERSYAVEMLRKKYFTYVPNWRQIQCNGKHIAKLYKRRQKVSKGSDVVQPNPCPPVSYPPWLDLYYSYQGGGRYRDEDRWECDDD